MPEPAIRVAHLRVERGGKTVPLDALVVGGAVVVALAARG
jgi:hypothetical protein